MLFFRTIITLFSGFSKFPELMERNPFRCFFHFLILCFLLALITSGFQVARHHSRASQLMEKLGGHFGGISVTEKGIFPLKNKETPATFRLSKMVRFTYLPADSIAASASETIRSNELIQIFWAPRGFLLCTNLQPDLDNYLLFHLPLPGKSFFKLAPQDYISSQSMTADGVVKYLSARYSLKPDEKLPCPVPETILPEQVLEFVTAFLASSLFFANFITLAFYSFFTILIFSLMLTFLRGRKYASLRFKNIFAIILYSVFVPLIISSIFLVWPIPYLSFQMIFFILFFIYQILAFRAIDEHLNCRKQNGNSDDQNFL